MTINHAAKRIFRSHGTMPAKGSSMDARPVVIALHTRQASWILKQIPAKAEAEHRCLFPSPVARKMKSHQAPVRQKQCGIVLSVAPRTTHQDTI
ncbi:hypothetical protein N7532_005441 [Penicillium argentinense]|uniref:Uncharacterized protein n=1 Tax=Penicillium argentinense TaxID=1131581 RepID=A0A9W9FE66_9EURO|nr:uncharacterized protein N7532_005441 [Penicillium argentinense]KAJ5098440.1 hypothetical protein N7532_005441 [Penicillium argentinense]